MEGKASNKWRPEKYLRDSVMMDMNSALSLLVFPKAALAMMSLFVIAILCVRLIVFDEEATMVSTSPSRRCISSPYFLARRVKVRWGGSGPARRCKHPINGKFCGPLGISQQRIRSRGKKEGKHRTIQTPLL
ncbi:nitrile specifier protein 3, partial [Striga asiatica]